MVEVGHTRRRRDELREKIGEQLHEKLDPARTSEIDGVSMSSEEESTLNEAFALTFRGRRGIQVLDYLARLTVERIAGPAVDPNTLLHMEGGRYVYGVIKARLELGRERK